MNKIQLIGRTVANPELIKTPNDKSVCRMTLAVNRRFKNADGERETDFISITIWGKSAENFVSYVKKGALIAVEGEIRTRSYVDKTEQKRYITEVLCLSYEMLESRAAIALRQGKEVEPEIELDAEELPF